MSSKVLNLQNMNQNMVKLQYAVRGPVLLRALAIEKEMKQGKSFPFKKIIKAHLGDAQAMGQRPISYIRQVLACVSCPNHLDEYDFPDDVKKRACAILKGCGGKSIGSYTHSQGMEMIRKKVAEFIERRDGHSCNWENISLTTGATSGIKSTLQLFSGNNKHGVMVPVPQYPLYSATLVEYGLQLVGYYLDEETNWGLDVKEMQRAIDDARKNGICVKALVVINPGNPTGQVLSRKNIEDLICFAHQHRLFLFADEVYQDNVYTEGSEFASIKKILTLEYCVSLILSCIEGRYGNGDPYCKMEIASFMSASKGYTGECGIRGGWVEYMNLHKDVQLNLYKTMSAALCPTTLGQAAICCIAAPPREGDQSYKLWCREKSAVLTSLAERAKLIVDTFNCIQGFKCQTVQGAMYAFPKIDLPPKAVEAAKAKNQAADLFYTFQLLENTGICIVAGSGFQQRPGTWHFRTTIMPPMPLLKEMLSTFKSFHEKFIKEYS